MNGYHRSGEQFQTQFERAVFAKNNKFCLKSISANSKSLAIVGFGIYLDELFGLPTGLASNPTNLSSSNLDILKTNQIQKCGLENNQNSGFFLYPRAILCDIDSNNLK